jgi:hypothetical protein
VIHAVNRHVTRVETSSHAGISNQITHQVSLNGCFLLEMRLWSAVY